MRQERNHSLDGLRAFAAISVLLFHAQVPIFGNGAQGVQIFFVLSGFLITSLIWSELRRTGEVNLFRFMRRRLRRLVPALLLMVGVTVILTPYLLPQWMPLNVISGVLAATYLMNLGVALGMPWTPLGHTWTLALEMQFYLLWPPIAALLFKATRPALILGALCAAVFSCRLLLGDSLTSFAQSEILCIECLLLGAIVAVRPPFAPSVGTTGALLLLLAMFAPGAVGDFIRSLPSVEIGAMMLVGGLRTPSAVSRVLSWRPFVYLGLISYGIYLWHAPLTRVFNSYGWATSGAATLGMATILASISYLTVERWSRAPASFSLEPRRVETSR